MSRLLPLVRNRAPTHGENHVQISVQEHHIGILHDHVKRPSFDAIRDRFIVDGLVSGKPLANLPGPLNLRRGVYHRFYSLE